MIILFTSLLLLSTLIMDVLGMKINIFAEHSTYFYSLNSILIVGLAFSLFYFFLQKPPFYNKIINEVSASSLGVYLIHDNQYVRPFLWQRITGSSEYQNSYLLLVHMIISVICVFLICTLIDYMRRKIFATKLDDYIGRVCCSKSLQ